MEKLFSCSIDFIIRKVKNKKDAALIYVRITVDGKQKEISIKERIAIDDWNSVSEKWKEKPVKSKK